MASDVMNLFAMAITAVADWFNRVMTGSGVGGIVLGMFVVWASVKYLLGPLMFSSGSDKAKKKDTKEVS